MGDDRVERGRAWWNVWPRSSLDDPGALTAELAGLVEQIDTTVGAGTGSVPEVRWVVAEPSPATDEVAAEAGLDQHRDLLQLTRPLPVGGRERQGIPAVAVRPFRVGRDEGAWLEVNARAFADHPDQGRTTAAELARLEAEPWFDPAGFLVLDGEDERAGRLDGFCWTKVHPSPHPLGEIFVIGVDPDRHGERLGPALTLAGLDHLHEVRGVETAMLYMEADNDTAARAYDRLGFREHHRERVYLRR